MSEFHDRRRRIVLRADSGNSIGMGHFIRTVALAAYLSDEFECVIASRNPESGKLSDYHLSCIAGASARVLEIRRSELESFNNDFLRLLRPDDIVVLDNYYYTTEYQQKVRELSSHLVCVDDLHSRHFVSDVVITCSPLVREDFSLEDYTQFYGGMEWAFLRQPFLAPLRERKPVIAGARPARIALAMGGSDPFNLTDKYIDIIKKELPESEINVIAGNSVVVEKEGVCGVKVWRQADASVIADLFDKSDVGLFPASTVCVEGISRGLPIIAGYYVDNQLDIYNGGVSRGWFAPIGNLLDADDEIAARFHEALNHIVLPPKIDFNGQRDRIRGIFRGFDPDF